MLINEAYDYLLRVRNIDQKIQEFMTQRDEIKAFQLMPGTHIDLSFAQRFCSDKTGSVFASVDDLNKAISRLSIRKAETIIEISPALDLLQDEIECTVLIAYYIGCLSMSEIADAIGYSLQHVYRLRKLGVEHLSRALV